MKNIIHDIERLNLLESVAGSDLRKAQRYIGYTNSINLELFTSADEMENQDVTTF